MLFYVARIADACVVRSNHVAVRIGKRCYLLPREARRELVTLARFLAPFGHASDSDKTLLAQWCAEHEIPRWEHDAVLYSDACVYYHNVSKPRHYAG